MLSAFYLFIGVGKSIIFDESILEAITRGRAKVARVSESTPTPVEPSLAVPTVEVARGSERTAVLGTYVDADVLEEEALRRYTGLCRMLTHCIVASGGTTPRSAIITAIREPYKLRKRWRADRTRQPGESEEGDGVLTLDKMREMAEEGRCPFSIKAGSCRPCFPKSLWDLPDEADYNDTPEVDFLRFIAGIDDAIEMAGRWDEFKIENAPGQPPGRGSPYRNSVVAMACAMLRGTPDPPWKNVQELIKDLDPETASQGMATQVGAVCCTSGGVASGSSRASPDFWRPLLGRGVSWWCYWRTFGLRCHEGEREGG